METVDRKGLWLARGFCRAIVHGNKFHVLFPKLETPEVELRTARSLRVTLHPSNESVTIDDEARVVSVLAKMSVFSTDLGPFGSGWDKIELFLPNGSVATLWFVTPTILVRKDWGLINLRSREFYDELCELLSKAKGQRSGCKPAMMMCQETLEALLRSCVAQARRDWGASLAISYCFASR